MLIVLGHIHVSPSDVASFIAEMAPFGDAARARDGCLFYAVVPDDPHVGRILVAERWRDQASLDAHLASTEMASFVTRWRDRMSGTPDEFDAANGRALKAL